MKTAHDLSYYIAVQIKSAHCDYSAAFFLDVVEQTPDRIMGYAVDPRGNRLPGVWISVLTQDVTASKRLDVDPLSGKLTEANRNG